MPARSPPYPLVALLPLLWAGVFLCACAWSGGGVVAPPTDTIPDATPGGRCVQWDDPVAAGRLDSEGPREASGLAASEGIPGLWWAIDDSGNDPILFGLDQAGRTVQRWDLGVPLVDSEDLAVARCPGRSDGCVYVADTGDNKAVRDSVDVWAWTEPDATRPPRRVARWTLRWPDGPRNIETLLVSPDGSEAAFVVKPPVSPDSTRHAVYAVSLALPPTSSGVEVDLTPAVRVLPELSVATDKGELFTGGAVDRASGRVLLRSYSAIYEFRGRQGSGLAALLAGSAVVLPGNGPRADEVQGESVSYSVDGTQIWTVSEGKKAPLHRRDCVEWEPR